MQQVLSALQKAHTAKHNIGTNSPPVRLDTMQLPDQRAKAPLQRFRWTSLQCSHATFSSCGRWAAVCLTGEQQRHYKSILGRRLVKMITASQVVLYSTTGGFQQQASFCTGTSTPAIAWSGAAAHLSIALHPRCRCKISSTEEVGWPVFAALGHARQPEHHC